MIQLKTKHKGNTLYIIHKMNKSEQIAFLEQSLIEEGAIPQLRPVQIETGFTGTKMQFALNGCISLETYLNSGIDLRAFCACMVQIIHTIQNCESHGISISNLELRPSYIYFEPGNGQVIMLYWPINSVKEYPNIRGLFVALGECYLCRPGEERLYDELLAMICKREKPDLSEWEKRFMAYQGRNGIPSGKAGLYHIQKKRDIMLKQYPFTVGRQSGACDYVVNDGLVSRQHFEILMREGRFYVRDLNSANGTHVDGRMIGSGRECMLDNNSVITAGNQRFQFSLK